MTDFLEELHRQIPGQVIEVIQSLEAAGFEAWLVGGGIRDALLGRKPEDWDVATSATAEQIAALFPHTVPLGARFGTVRILMPESPQDTSGSVDSQPSQYVPVDAAAFRIDSAYSDRRRPDAVVFTGSLQADLLRRDFTINAMAWHPDRGLYDPMGGARDLEGQIIQTVGAPRERFDEDPLRILRGIRFAAQLDYQVAPDTLEAMKQLAPLLVHISVERKQAELEKILLSNHCARGLSLVEQTGVMGQLLPASWKAATTADPLVAGTLETPIQPIGLQNFRRLCDRIDRTRKDKSLRWGLLYLCFPATAHKDIRDMRFDHRLQQMLLKNPKEQKHLFWMLQSTSDLQALKIAWKGYLAELGFDRIREVLELAIEAETLGIQAGNDGTDLAAPATAPAPAPAPTPTHFTLNTLADLTEQILTQREPVFLKDLAIDGRDLKEMGITGPRIGQVLQQLMALVHRHPEANEKYTLLKEISATSAGL